MDYVEWLRTFDISAITTGSQTYTPQWVCIIGSDGRFAVNHFVRVESLSVDWEKLQRIYPGLPNLPDQAIRAAKSQVKADEVASGSAWPDFCRFYVNRSLATAIIR